MQEIHESVWQAPGVQVYGRVAIGEGSSLWPYVVIRAECEAVVIGRMTNIQDFAMVHVGFEVPTRIGDFCSITHHATVHGATIEDACLIGVGAVIMNGAVIGAGSIVAGNACVSEGSVFPPHSVIAGTPAKRIRQRDSRAPNILNAWVYHRNALAYARGEHRAWEGEAYQRWHARKLREIERELSE